ncbi:helix-turn-helix domain-containing protein [Pseudomonas congelans]|uniref:helix-turn-helix domain-containing protein n=1 Tax=Pseudomonas congelans TaxID=200452 RepID=UPI0039A06D17
MSGAAAMLGLEHATVSRRIASLEKSLNVKLIDRRKRLHNSLMMRGIWRRSRDRSRRRLRLLAGLRWRLGWCRV